MVPFVSSGMVSYSPSIVTMAVFFSHFGDIQCQTMRDLGNQVSGRSRSLKIAPFDRPHATLYSSAIVNIALSCIIFEFFDVE